MGDDLKDVRELKEIMEVISETVPELLDKITKVLYDAQEGEKMGQAVAAFYKALVDSGMSNEQAYSLTKEYMSSMSLGGMISGFAKQEIHTHSKHDHDFEDEIKEKIKKEILSEMEKK